MCKNFTTWHIHRWGSFIPWYAATIKRIGGRLRWSGMKKRVRDGAHSRSSWQKSKSKRQMFFKLFHNSRRFLQSCLSWSGRIFIRIKYLRLSSSADEFIRITAGHSPLTIQWFDWMVSPIVETFTFSWKCVTMNWYSSTLVPRNSAVGESWFWTRCEHTHELHNTLTSRRFRRSFIFSSACASKSLHETSHKSELFGKTCIYPSIISGS